MQQDNVTTSFTSRDKMKKLWKDQKYAGVAIFAEQQKKIFLNLKEFFFFQ